MIDEIPEEDRIIVTSENFGESLIQSLEQAIAFENGDTSKAHIRVRVRKEHTMETDTALREQLLHLLCGGNAHLSFDEAVAEFPPEAINQRPPNVPYTPWHLLEHLRLAQWDILDFIRNPDYQAMKWPDDYWPAPDAKADTAAWQQTIAAFHADLKAVEDLVHDPQTDLAATIPHGDGQTILREILLVADHNAYHIGEFAILRQVMGTWNKQ